MIEFLAAIYIYFLRPILTVLMIMVIVYVVMSWLVAFRVVNPHNQFVDMIGRVTQAITEPLLRPFRRVVPLLGGVDLSPFLLILTIIFVRDWALPKFIGLLGRAAGA